MDTPRGGWWHPEERSTAAGRWTSGRAATFARMAEHAAPPEGDEWNESGIDELSSIAGDTLEDERQRGRGLDTKTASLAGATGVILSLNATLGVRLLTADVGRVGVWVERGAFILAVVALVGAMVAAVLGVLWPQQYEVLERGQLKSFTQPETLRLSRTEVQLAMLQTTAKILDEERGRNDRKKTATKWAAGLLAAGLVAVSAEALTLGIWNILHH